jgi:hypothetical protein
MINDTLKQVNIYLDKQLKTLREENARLNAARITDMNWAKDQCDEIISTYMLVVAELKAEKAELEDALLRQTVIVRYYAGDFVCECGWVVDVGTCGDSKFDYCPSCGSKLNFTEVEK